MSPGLITRDEHTRPYLLRLTQLDRLIYAPARLGLLGVLASHKLGSMSYLELLEITGLSNSNLSKQLAKLEGSGIVEIQKRFVGKKPETLVLLTRFGRERLTSHLKGMF